ncbi:Alpha- and gamma-adaptin-binding protein p34 [Globisporangium polare]
MCSSTRRVSNISKEMNQDTIRTRADRSMNVSVAAQTSSSHSAPVRSCPSCLCYAPAEPAATPRVAALPHVVVVAISDCLDHALSTIWSLPRACETNLQSFLPRLAARGASVGVDPYL